MCRLLIVKSTKVLNHLQILSGFARMCEKSRSPDGDWQGDGWGIAYKDKDTWKLEKSLKPIWEEQEMLSLIPATELLVIHARSSGFPDQKGILEYNQPYISGGTCFVFNGMIRGIRLNRTLDGTIGAQKIFSFLRQEVGNVEPEQALRVVRQTIFDNSRDVQGMNIGLVSGSAVYALCEYSQNSEYFTLRYAKDNNTTILCSEKIGLYDWKHMDKGEIKIFR